MLNHGKTIETIKNFEALLKEIRAKQERANSQIKEWGTDTLYSPTHKENKIREIKTEFETAAATYTAKMYALAQNIIDAENELLNSTIDINDAELATALSIINSVGAGMPIDQQRLIAKKFRGDYHAEQMLDAVYKKNGLDYKIEFTDFRQLHRELLNRIAVFSSDSEKTVVSYRGVEKALNKMLEAINSDYRVDIGVKMLSFMAAVHAGAGLDMPVPDSFDGGPRF